MELYSGYRSEIWRLIDTANALRAPFLTATYMDGRHLRPIRKKKLPARIGELAALGRPPYHYNAGAKGRIYITPVDHSIK
jgi:hypothetical protein